MTNRRQFFNIPAAGSALPKLPDQPEPAAVFNGGQADIEQLSAETQQAIVSGTTRRPFYQQLQISIPAGGASPVNLPVIPDRVYFYTTAVFALPLLIGPDQGFLPLPAGTYICLPGTAKIYWIANPNTAAVVVTLIATRDLPEFEIGGVGSGVVTAGGVGQAVQLVGFTGDPVTVAGIGADALGINLSGLIVLSSGLLFNGVSWDRIRKPVIFKPLSAVVITAEATIWTPAAGKKFRLMGFLLAQGVVTGAVTIRDNTAGATIFIIPAHTVGVVIPPPDLGNGILSSVANNVLTAQGAATETLTGVVFGMEE